MSAPVLPSDLLARIPSTTADKCTAFTNALIAFPRLVYQLFAYIFTSTGEVSDAFKYLLGDAAGTIKLTASSSTPTGYLECNGAAVSRVTYLTLFEAIGVSFGGGDGATTFNLPDLRGRSPMGAGTGSGLTPRVLGTSYGEETHLQTEGEVGPHSHDFTVTANNAEGGGTGELTGGSSNSPNDGSFDGTTEDNTAAATPFNVIHPVLAVRFIIKY